MIDCQTLPFISIFFRSILKTDRSSEELWGAGSTFSEQEILTQLYFNYYANLHLVSVVWGLVYLNVNYLLFIWSVNNPPLKLIALFALSSYYMYCLQDSFQLSLHCIVRATLHCNWLWDCVLKSAKHLRLHEIATSVILVCDREKINIGAEMNLTCKFTKVDDRRQWTYHMWYLYIYCGS